MFLDRFGRSGCVYYHIMPAMLTGDGIFLDFFTAIRTFFHDFSLRGAAFYSLPVWSPLIFNQ